MIFGKFGHTFSNIPSALQWDSHYRYIGHLMVTDALFISLHSILQLGSSQLTYLQIH